MRYHIEFVEIPVDPELDEFVSKKLQSLSKKYDWIIRADVFFKKEKDTRGKGNICEIRLSLPGPRIFASSDEDSYQAAIAESINNIETQLRQRKDEMQAF